MSWHLTATNGRAETIARIGELLNEAPDQLRPDQPWVERDRILARARAEAEAIRREAIVTADGIRQIALEDAKEMRATRGRAREHLEDRVARLERKLDKQRRRIERLEPALLGLTPGLRKKG